MEDNLSVDWGEGYGLGASQTHYIYCALNFYYHYTLIFNGIFMQAAMQNQWES